MPVELSPSVPDFGMLYSTFERTVLSCKATAPGISFHDLVMHHEAGVREALPGDELAGNPGRWPVCRGLRNVVAALLNAIYDAPGAPAAPSQEGPLVEMADAWMVSLSDGRSFCISKASDLVWRVPPAHRATPPE